MVFSSTVFLFIFLPSVWAIYSLIPKRFILAKNIVLSLASIVFYAFGEPVYIVIMLASVLFNYISALLIAPRSGKVRTLLCGFCIAVNLCVLGTFKYLPWLVGLVNSAFGCAVPVPGLTIPVGISFYTFQILSYVIDVYRGKVGAQRNFTDLFLYISFFPQLIAGPIVKYSDIADQIKSRDITLEKTGVGIKRFILGLSKKILISNTAAVIADAAFGASSPSSVLAWSGAVCYCIQLYFDFSGYSDMAIGLASIFGFSLNENFNYPYAAFSIRDFWKRWHISLTTWFREYVYFPLGGNRRGKGCTVFNRLVIFFLTGLWHGANFTYILWGLWHGVLMMFEQLVDFERVTSKRMFRPLTRVYTLLCVLLGFVMFRADSVSSAFSFIGRMFSFCGDSADALLHFSPWVCVMLLCGIVFSTPVLPWIREKMSATESGRTAVSALGYVISIPLLALCVMSLVSSSFNPFIYYIF